MALIQCKECKKEISDQADSCPHCGFKNKQKNNSGCAILFLIVLLGVIIGTLGVNNKNPSQPTLQKQPIVQTRPKWHYYNSNDEMTGNHVYIASIESENQVNFQFPYNGLQRAELRARTHPRWGKDLMFKVRKGQILCTSYRGCNIRVKFDDGKLETFSAKEPSDHSTEIIFISNYSRFMGKLLKAKTVKISVEFYQEGARTFTFNIADFSVDKYRPK